MPDIPDYNLYYITESEYDVNNTRYKDLYANLKSISGTITGTPRYKMRLYKHEKVCMILRNY